MFDIATTHNALELGLARLRSDGCDRSVGELVDLVGECQSVINQASALQALAMAHVAAIEDIELEDGTVAEQHRGLGHQRLDAPDLVSDQLGLSSAAASTRMGAAVDVVTRLGGVFGAMAKGRLDTYRAGIVSDELREAPAEVCAQVVARVAEELGSEPPAALRRRVRAALTAVDADLVRDKAARARAERSLCRWPGNEPGVDTWMGSFPVEQSRSGWAVVDGLARQYVRDGRVAGLEQARADALMDLIHARATGTFVVQLAVPADTAGARALVDTSAALSAPSAARAPSQTVPAGSAVVGRQIVPAGSAGAGDRVDATVTVAGFGMPGSVQVRREWLESLLGSETGAATRARREVVTCHATSGALLAVADSLDTTVRRRRDQRAASTTYRPPAAMVELVKARDGRCRFPGCSVNARFCDLDHVIPWPVGLTHPTNLICLCRRHHRIKQTVRWRVRMAADATVTWTDPTGRPRMTLPIDFLQLASRADDAAVPDVDAACATSPNATTRTADGRLTEGMTTLAAPRDTLAVGWSAWEEELAHEASRAERHFARPRAHGPHAEDRPGRGVLWPELRTGLGSFTLDPAYADRCRTRKRRRRATTEIDPPF